MNSSQEGPHRILFQFDTDSQCSTFDTVVAVDAGVDRLFQYAAVDSEQLTALVHGTMFTRGVDQLKRTAIFVGGSNVEAGERLVDKITKTFFGPVRVSVMLDSNGANTTAAAAVLSAAKHESLGSCCAMILGGTGPVGQRVARLILGQGGRVILVSRSLQKAQETCQKIVAKSSPSQAAQIQPLGTDSTDFSQRLGESTLLFACGAAGVQLIDTASLDRAHKLKVAIDLNAVPPAGIEPIGVTDKAVRRGERIDYGAIGVGGLKMKIHRAAIAALFDQNDLVLDAEQIFEIGQKLSS